MNVYRFVLCSRSIKELIALVKDDKIDLKPYVKQGFDFDQLCEIAEALNKHVNPADIATFANTSFNHYQLEVIFDGLKDGLDVSCYAKPDYTPDQMREIYYGLKNDIDVNLYAKPEISSDYMREIRLAMESNCIEKFLEFLKSSKYTSEQLHEIRLGLEVGLDASIYANISYPAELMKVFREGIEKGLHPDVYLEYYHKGFTTDQLAVIRDGFLAKVDVKLYAHLTTPPEHMREILNRLINMKK